MKIGLPGKSILRDCIFNRIGLREDLFSYRESVFREDLFSYNSSLPVAAVLVGLLGHRDEVLDEVQGCDVSSHVLGLN